VTHVKAAEVFGLRISRLDAVHPSARRSVTQLVDQRLNYGFITFEMRLNRAVGAIAYPAANT
jgi:hypothetical protein